MQTYYTICQVKDGNYTFHLLSQYLFKTQEELKEFMTKLGRREHEYCIVQMDIWEK